MLTICPECSGKVSTEAFLCPHCGFRIAKPNLLDKASRRANAEVETKHDLEKSHSHLLADIHDESLDRTRPEGETVARTMARFAALQILLSKEADKVAQSNIKIQSRLIGLTVAILLLTGIMLAVQVVQFICQASS